MLILAHRGYHANVPENTLAAFEQAVALGVDGIETDVRLTSDGIPILFHDRCVRDGLDVSELTYADIQQIADYPIPTLESAIAEWDRVLWNLEIKTESALDAVVEMVQRYNSKRRFILTSFIHRVIIAALDRVDVEGGFLFAHMPRMTSELDQLRPDMKLTTLVWDFEASDRSVVEKFADKGFKNAVYGPLTPRDHQTLVSWNISAIITDFPQSAIKARG